jgi:glycosyltransferase involved in cell wall biosynthesis
VTLFATADSETRGRLVSVVPRGYAEDLGLCAKVWECLHISEVFERAAEFDLIHNHFDFLPLTYSQLVKTPLITTIHGFSSPEILPVYEKYNGRTLYVAISNADRSQRLDYVGTVYHGIDLRSFTFQAESDDFLVFLGRIHPDKGAAEAIEIARRANRRLILAGVVQDAAYFRNEVQPQLDGIRVTYVGSVGPESRNRLLGGAVALLHPISFAEPFGLSVVEAMACGTPVVAFERGSMPELIRDGSTGFLVRDVGEAVAALGRVSGLDRRACRQHVEQRFTVKRMVDEYLRVYRSVLGRERRPAQLPATAGVG